MDGYPLTLSVPRADTAKNLLQFRHTAYLVQIDDCGRVYECHRRYTNFLWLHRELKQREVAGALPELPPKRGVGSLEQTFVEQRRRLLEAYLRALLRIPQVVLDDTLWAFLDADMATAAVPRFLCRPASPAGAFECLTQLATVAAHEGSAFRLCSMSVLRELVKFTQEEAGETAVQAAPGAQPALQARLGSRLRLCAIVQLLARQERARQGLVEAGMFGALLALLWRTTLDCLAAVQVQVQVSGANKEVEAHETACSAVKQCLNVLLEGSQGLALLDFCQQDSGLKELQRLVGAENSMLHSTVAQLLWSGFQSSSVVAALAGAKMGLPLVGKLLTSSELPARILASLCICRLVRDPGALDADARGHCLEALPPVTQLLEAAEAESVARAAAASLTDLGATDVQLQSQAPPALPVPVQTQVQLQAGQGQPQGAARQAAQGAQACSVGAPPTASIGLIAAAGAGVGRLAAQRDHVLVDLLRRLCSPSELDRLKALLEEEGPGASESAVAPEESGDSAGYADDVHVVSGEEAETGVDAVTRHVVAVLDHFVRQSLEEPERIRPLNALSGRLQRLLDSARDAETSSRAARILVRLEWSCGGAGPGGRALASGHGHEAPAFPAFGQRLRVLESLTQQAEWCQSEVAEHLSRAHEHCRRQHQEVMAACLTEEPCLGSAQLDSFCSHLAGLAEQRGGLQQELQSAQQAVEALSVGLDQRGVQRGVLSSDVAALRLALSERAAGEERAEEARAVATLREKHGRDAAAAAEEQLVLVRGAEAALAEVSQRSRAAESEAAALAQTEAERAEICHSAPAQVERLQSRLLDIEQRKATALQSALQVDSDHDAEERRAAALAEAEQEAESALQTLSEVHSKLQVFRKTLASELILNDDEVSQLRRMEEELQPARPSRLRHAAESNLNLNLAATHTARLGLGTCEEEPPEWCDGAEAEFREAPHFRAFTRLREERERLWTAEQHWLQATIRHSQTAASGLKSRRAAVEVEAQAREAEAGALRRDLAFWARPAELQRSSLEATAAAEAARSAARAEAAEASEATGRLQLEEARLEQARQRAAAAEAAFQSAREAAADEAQHCQRERLELERRCVDLETRTKAYLEGWTMVELEERQILLFQGQVASHLQDEAQSRSALRSEIAQLISDLGALDAQLAMGSCGPALASS